VSALLEIIVSAISDPSVAVIAIRGEGRDFCAGADIQDFENAPHEVDRLRELFSVVDACPKPVVAMLHGNVLGGGLELALAAHFRVATPDARLGFPEVTLGLLPGGGGTQRLPRRVGVARALDMILGGKSVAAGQAAEIGLVDAVLEGEAALAWVIARAESSLADRATTGPAVADSAALDVWRAKIAQRSLGNARESIVACIEAATRLDLQQGLAFERELFTDLLMSEASRGLRHSFFAERKVGRLPGSEAKFETPTIASVAVIGAGTMGSGIVLALLSAELPVTLIELNEKALSAGVGRIAKALDRDVAKGRLTEEKAAARKALLTTESTVDAAAQADLVIEAVFEDIEVKRSVFAQLDRIAKPGAILASNTSTLDVDRIADATQRPHQVVGLHFFSPANIMRLVEVVRGAATSAQTLAGALALVRKIGKVGVIAGNCDGFIGNRIFEEYLRQAYWLLEEGALPAQVDAALESWGMAMGPLRTMDLAGQDIGWSIRKRRAVTQPNRPYSKIPDLICEMGRFGQKTGAGYYRYADGRTPESDPEIDELVIRHSTQIGVERRVISDEEIVERCVFAMVNEGARILSEGIAQRSFDIDVIYVNGYGFPAERGGPMFYADRVGAARIIERMNDFRSRREGWAWEPAPLIEWLVEHGETFADLKG
ncbi:MAG: 3-hydroxyacyl-CoA dehydrogenase NAD-binding domain-containing protein, partial [Pseudomonas sp.]